MVRGQCGVFATFALLYCVSAMDDCAVNTTNVWMPSAGSGDCYCGGTVAGSCDPDPQSAGLSKSSCKKDNKDFKTGGAEGNCGWYCLCAGSQVAGGKLTGVTCCKAGAKVGLSNNKVIAHVEAPAAASGDDVVPSGAFAILPMTWSMFLVGTMAI